MEGALLIIKQEQALPRKGPSMKTTMMLVLAALISTPSFAKDNSKAPCKQIVQACEAGGYTKGGHKNQNGKGLWKDCVRPLKEGKTVANVNVDPTVVQACVAKKAARKNKTASAPVNTQPVTQSSAQ